MNLIEVILEYHLNHPKTLKHLKIEEGKIKKVDKKGWAVVSLVNSTKH